MDRPDLSDLEIIVSDNCSPDRTEEVERRSPVGVIRTGVRIIDGRGATCRERPNRVEGRSTVDFFRGWFAGDTGMYFCSTMHNTEKLLELGGFQSRTSLFQDVVAVVQLAALYGRVDLPDVKASFRRHDANNGTSARVEDWCEDSLYLLELMCELAPDRAETIRRGGLPFLCRTNYRQAASIAFLPERLQTYWTVYGRFHRSYPPWTFADAILDRIVHHAHRITLKGESMRRTKPNTDPSQTATA